jgi:Glycosyltransferase family 87
MTTTPTTGSQNGAAAPQWERHAGWLSPVTVAIAGATLVALILRAYLLVRPGVMTVTQYDDGPYFGSAVRLVHGVLPYRDFAFVQPPGITLLMSPLGLASNLTGTAWGLVIGRVFTVIAGAAAVVLGGLLVRHRGLLAVVLTCGILAIYPPGADSSHTVLLEPWLVLFCLAGAVAVFDGDRLTPGVRRLAWGGAAFGFAGAVKVWAIVPVLVVALLCLPSLRRAATFTAGVAAGFLIPVLPFALASPRAFYNDVVVAQLSRVGKRVPVWHRLASMIAIPGALQWTHGNLLAAWLALLAFVVVVQAAAWRAAHSPPPPLDWFATLSAVLVVAMFLWPTYFATHYSAFLAPFLAMAVALPCARLVAGLRPAAGTRRQAAPGQAARWLAGFGVVLAGLALMTAGAVAQAPAGRPSRNRKASIAAVGRVVPPGACVATDQASYLLLANRFTSDVPGCSQMVDGLGTDLALSGGRRPHSGAGKVPAVIAAWHQAFSHAAYVLLSAKNTLRVPWTPLLTRYFDRNFAPILHGYSYTLYKRTAPGAGNT